MPAPRIVPRRDRIADPALDLDAEDEGGEQVPPGRSAGLRQRQHRRGDRRRRMNDRVEMGVVEIEQIGRNRIDEGGAERIEPFRTADDADGAGAAEREPPPAARSSRPDHSPIPARSRKNSGSSVWLHDFAAATSAHDLVGNQIRERRADALRPPLPHLANSLNSLFFERSPASRDLSTRNLMLDRLTDNPDIRTNGRDARSGDRPITTTKCARTSRERRERDDGRTDHWFCRPWPHGRTDGRGGCSMPAIRCRSTTRRLRPWRRSSRVARVCAKSPAEVASSADIVLASLPTPDIVKAVALGADGIIAGTRAQHSDRPVDDRARRRQDDRGRLQAQKHHAGRCAGQRRHHGRDERHAGGDGVLPRRPPSRRSSRS